MDFKDNIWSCKRRRILENTNKQGDRGHIKAESIAKLIKSLQLRWYGHAERMKNKKCQNKLQDLQLKNTKEGKTR